MRVLFLWVCFVQFSFNALSQSNKVIEKSDIDSGLAFIQRLDRQNFSIAQAYNSIGKRLMAEGPDSLVFSLIHYKNVCKNALSNTSGIAVAEHLQPIKMAYCQWIHSIIEFNEMHLMKLETYYQSKKQLLQTNPEADTKYVDGQIQEFFKQLDETQYITRSNYLQEVENLKYFDIQEPENKK